MQLVLLAAAIINLVITGDVATSVVLAGLTVFNALIGLRQEAKAEETDTVANGNGIGLRVASTEK